MSETVETETDPVPEMEKRYLGRAAERVEQLTPDQPPVGEGDLDAVQLRIQRALEDDAAHELREILSQIRGTLEMADLSGGEDGSVVVDRDRVDDLMGALDRAEAVLETHLDPSTVLMLLVRLEPREFDLTRHLRHFLTTHGIDPSGGRIRGEMDSVTVEADRSKVVEALGHLALHLYQRSSPQSVLVVDAGPAPDGNGASGHIGLDPAPYDEEDLVEELDQSFRINTLEIDIPYVRAVMERHGGNLHVNEGPDGSLGYSFHLPASPPEVPR